MNNSVGRGVTMQKMTANKWFVNHSKQTNTSKSRESGKSGHAAVCKAGTDHKRDDNEANLCLELQECVALFSAASLSRRFSLIRQCNSKSNFVFPT